MAKYATELLKDINDNPELLTTTYRRKKDAKGMWVESALSILFQASYDPAAKFLLPETEPPYKVSEIPIGVGHSTLFAEVSRFYMYLRKDISPNKRQTLFVQALERISAEEAKVLLAIKDQKLHRLYPNITHQLVADADYIAQSSVPDIYIKKTIGRPRKDPEADPKPKTRKAKNKKPSKRGTEIDSLSVKDDTIYEHGVEIPTKNEEVSTDGK